MRSPREMIVALCIVGIASAVGAQGTAAKVEPVLKHIPAGAAGFVVVNDVASLVGKVEKLMAEYGVDQMLEFGLDRQLERVLSCGEARQGMLIAGQIVYEVDQLAERHLVDSVEINRRTPRQSAPAACQTEEPQDRRTSPKASTDSVGEVPASQAPTNRLEASVFSDAPTTRVGKTLGSKFLGFGNGFAYCSQYQIFKHFYIIRVYYLG